VRVDPDFTYSSDNNHEWLSADELRNWVADNGHKIGVL